LNFHLDPTLVPLLQVILIDITLAGDNAIVIGLVAMNVPPAERRKVIFWGLAAAVVLLIALATMVMKLLTVIGLTLAGGALLLLVSWRLYRDLRAGQKEKEAIKALGETHHAHGDHRHYFSMRKAVFQIALADLSMSLDNVLAVAGAAQGHTWVLIVGLSLSIVLVGLASVFIAQLMQRYPWISYIGLALIVYVAVRMIWEGAGQLVHSL
jgi:YjbE family integral membrane protein